MKTIAELTISLLDRRMLAGDAGAVQVAGRAISTHSCSSAVRRLAARLARLAALATGEISEHDLSSGTEHQRYARRLARSADRPLAGRCCITHDGAAEPRRLRSISWRHCAFACMSSRGAIRTVELRRAGSFERAPGRADARLLSSRAAGGSRDAACALKSR